MYAKLRRLFHSIWDRVEAPSESSSEEPEGRVSFVVRRLRGTPFHPLFSTYFRTDGFPGGSLLSGHAVPFRHYRLGFPIRIGLPASGTRQRGPLNPDRIPG